jgi:hypothetical protein
MEIKIVAFILLIIYMLITLGLVTSYTFTKATEADKYSILIDAGKKCVNQVNEFPNSQILPMCEITLKDILIKGTINNTIIKFPNEVFNNGTYR